MYNKFAKEFGNKIKHRREVLGLSQEEVADLAGVSRGYVGMIERAERALTLKKLYQVSRALGLTFNDLFDFDNLEEYTFDNSFDNNEI